MKISVWQGIRFYIIQIPNFVFFYRLSYWILRNEIEKKKNAAYLRIFKKKKKGSLKYIREKSST